MVLIFFTVNCNKIFISFIFSGTNSSHNFSSDLELIETARIFDNGPYQVWEDIYDLIIRDYVTDVYVDIMETFIAASIKVKLD